MVRRTLSLMLVFTLLSALVPAAALAASSAAAPAGPIDPKVPSIGGGVSSLAADVAPVDDREDDGTWNGIAGVPWATLPDLSDHMDRIDVDTPGWGMDPWTDNRTIDTANATNWDEDWYKLTVSAADMADWTQLSYRIDAFSMNPGVDLVLDVYDGAASPAVADTLSGGEDPAALVSNDDSWWGWASEYGVYGRSSSVAFMPPSAGVFYIRVRPFHSALNHFTGRAGAYTLRAKYGQVERIAGTDRIATAVGISREGWPTQPAESVETTVVIAYSQNYPDALSAASLAGACGSPVLLNGADTLAPAVADEIARLGYRNAYIVGGTSVIKPGVEAQLNAILGDDNVTRVAGPDRYETAREVLRATQAVMRTRGLAIPSVAFVVSGTNFPDALAVGPIAYRRKVPILLTRPDALTPTTASALAAAGIDDVIVAGGTAAVSAAAFSDISDIGIPFNRILRVSGADRYATAKEVAAWSCDLKGPGTESDNAIGTVNNVNALLPLQNPYLNAYASGASYPDALAGGAFAGKTDAPILLTRKDSVPVILFGADGEVPPGSTTWFSDLWNQGYTPIEQSYLLGGEAAVEAGTFLELDNNTGEAGAP